MFVAGIVARPAAAGSVRGAMNAPVLQRTQPMSTEATPPPPLAVSPAEAARLLGIGRTTFYALLKRGEIASFRQGARRLILVVELHRWLDRRARA